MESEEKPSSRQSEQPPATAKRGGPPRSSARHEPATEEGDPGAAAHRPDDPGSALSEPAAPPPPEASGSAAAPLDDRAFADAFAQAFQEFGRKLDAVWNPVDLGQSVAEAEAEMHQRQAAFAAPHQELERCEARLAYLRAIRQLASPARQRSQIDFAFARYLDAIRPLWAREDLHRIDPAILSQFGESIAWAAYYAGQRLDA